MPAANIHMRSAWLALQLGRVFLMISGLCCCALSSLSQIADSTTTDQPNNSWTATTDLKSDGLLPTRIPVRIIESHSQQGNRTFEERSVQIQGVDGRLAPYQEIETETLQVDASTVRTTMRTFAQDVNGAKSLIQVTEEAKHTLPGGDSNALRITFNPDVNGKLQPVQRELVETKTVGKDVEETNTTVMLPNINGGLAPAFKTHELRKRAADNIVEVEKTTWLPDVNGKWQLSEIRQNVTTQEARDRRIEEKVLRPDAEGKLSQISRVVSRESRSTTGEKRNTVENYSIDVPGTPRDGNLHLVERKTTIWNSSSTGERTSEQTVEQINPGDLVSGLRISVLVNGKMVPGPSAEESTVTIRVRDSNDNFGVVSVDTTKSDRIPTIQIQPTPSDQPK
jgi:hypothetical protein